MGSSIWHQFVTCMLVLDLCEKCEGWFNFNKIDGSVAQSDLLYFRVFRIIDFYYSYLIGSKLILLSLLNFKLFFNQLKFHENKHPVNFAFTLESNKIVANFFTFDNFNKYLKARLQTVKTLVNDIVMRRKMNY